MAGVFDHIAEVIEALQHAPGGFHSRIWQELGPWMTHFGQTGAKKWIARLSAAEPCHVVTRAQNGSTHRCDRPSIAHCVACHKPTCLSHGFIDSAGEAICFVCVGASARTRAAPAEDPHRDEELAWARRLLKVRASATWETIRSAHRKLSAHWHPDRYKTDAQKAKAEAKFKEIQKAFELLSKEHEKQAA